MSENKIDPRYQDLQNMKEHPIIVKPCSISLPANVVDTDFKVDFKKIKYA